MIDLHSHVLPGIDDGAPDLDASLALTRAAADGGVRILAATPHLRSDHPTVRPEELAGRCAELNARLEDEEISLEVVPGGEVDLEWASGASEEHLRLASYRQRGDYLLVETPYDELDGGFEDRLAALRDRGFRLLLAHPERSQELREDPARVAALVGAGVLVQVTARNLAGDDSSPSRAAALLVREGLAHVLASDAHGADGPAPPDLALGVAGARGLVGERAGWMVEAVPAAVLAGEDPPPPPGG